MNILTQIDNYFYNKPTKKEFQYTIILIIFLVGFIIYYFIFPIAQDFNKKNEKKYKNLISMIQDTKRDINILKSQKVRLYKDMKILKKKFIDFKKESMFFDELTSLVDFAQFNKEKWANLVKDVIINAKNDGLKIKLITNKIFNDKNESSLINKKMDIDIDLEGNYINFLYFIYSYEDRKDLIRVENIDINNSNRYFIKLRIYGYEK